MSEQWMTIELPRPRTVDDLEQGRQQASAKAYEEAGLDLVRQGEISSGSGAHLLKLSRVDFLELMRQHGMAIADYSEAELRQEIEDAWRY